jgi:steroid 5-alpha reductase family enzyme
MLQGVLALLIASPILLVNQSRGPALTGLDFLGLAVWCLGFFFETVGDYQLLQFKKNGINQGKIIMCGLWRYTRHPNYFGEATLWWGLFLIAFSVPGGWQALISPVLLSFLLLKVSGIPMLEVKYAGRPDWETYKKRTNAFFPWFPKSQ